MKFQGREGLRWWTGVVEDRDDPLFLNRVRVRIYGRHSHNKDQIATPDLPWSEVMMPTTSPSLSGMGTSTHGLVEGSTVMGFFRDGEGEQDPIVMGSFIGVPQDYYRVDETIDDTGQRSYQKIKRTPAEGFNDPRLASVGSYSGKPDGPSPKHINRNYGLTLSLKESPKSGGTDSAVNYPKPDYINQSDVNLLARPSKDNPVSKAYPILNDLIGEPKRANYINPIYPFNHVHETESGHVIELDDTPDYERIHLFHRKGTRFEIDKDGNKVERIVKNNYQVILGDNSITVSGNVYIGVVGNCEIKAEGDCNITSKDTNITSSGKVKVLASTEADIIASKIKLNA